MEDIMDTIRWKYEFVLLTKSQLEGKSTEYIEGFIDGCVLLLDFMTKRMKKEANHETGRNSA
jgi:hypothetical protein